MSTPTTAWTSSCRLTLNVRASPRARITGHSYIGPTAIGQLESYSVPYNVRVRKSADYACPPGCSEVVVSDERRIDDAALLRLLWRGDERPSARSGLTASRIVTAGVELADADGSLDRLSMRRVADELGVGAMSLYTYVPGRRELALLMLDQVYGELPDDIPGDGWRARLIAMAEQHWDLYQRHPWVHDLPPTRSALGPSVMDRYELELSLVDGLGLDELEMNAVIELVQSHVGGASERLRGIRLDTDESGLSDDEWWYSVLPTLTQVLADGEYPLSARVGTAIGAPHLDTEYLLRFGLDRILDGLAVLLEERSDAGSDTDPPR